MIKVQQLFKKGFTLIEVLIALSMLSIMMGLLFASMRTSVESWHTTENRVDETNKKAVFYQFFKQHLVNAKPLYEINYDNTRLTEIKKMVFQGDSTRIKFVSTLPAASIRKGEQIFNIGISQKNPNTIAVTLTPYREQKKSVDESILIDHVKQLEFSYFGKINENFDRIWESEWHDMQEQPRLVRIKVLLDDNSIWPDMIFPLKIASWHTSSLNQQDYKSFNDGNDKAK
ncbi:MAG: prepilin-type N-terminal cleavage/methylation domain-containing protein [Methylomonas sp.]